jgi:hypothetical protein
MQLEVIYVRPLIYMVNVDNDRIFKSRGILHTFF